MTCVAAYPQESMLEAASLAVIEFTLDIPRQVRTWRRQMGLECGAVLSNKLVQEGALRAMALGDRHIDTGTGSLPVGNGNKIASLRYRPMSQTTRLTRCRYKFLLIVFAVTAMLSANIARRRKKRT